MPQTLLAIRFVEEKVTELSMSWGYDDGLAK